MIFEEKNAVYEFKDKESQENFNAKFSEGFIKDLPLNTKFKKLEFQPYKKGNKLSLMACFGVDAEYIAMELKDVNLYLNKK